MLAGRVTIEIVTTAATIILSCGYVYVVDNSSQQIATVHPKEIALVHAVKPLMYLIQLLLSYLFPLTPLQAHHPFSFSFVLLPMTYVILL